MGTNPQWPSLQSLRVVSDWWAVRACRLLALRRPFTHSQHSGPQLGATADATGWSTFILGLIFRPAIGAFRVAAEGLRKAAALTLA